MIKRRDGTHAIEPVEQDQVVSDALRQFDPATEDSAYWFRFHRRVMASVRRELAGRRMLADLTVSEIMAGWARTVVPTALMVAATAALLLLRNPEVPGPLPLGVEQLLTEGSDGVGVPAVLISDLSADPTVVMMAFEEF